MGQWEVVSLAQVTRPHAAGAMSKQRVGQSVRDGVTWVMRDGQPRRTFDVLPWRVHRLLLLAIERAGNRANAAETPGWP
eukprot:563972-Pyramimonas_sp.AAC.1